MLCMLNTLHMLNITLSPQVSTILTTTVIGVICPIICVVSIGSARFIRNRVRVPVETISVSVHGGGVGQVKNKL